MEITRETLTRRYADLIDAELLRRVRSGMLTELARDVALAELASRGYSSDAVNASPPLPDVGDIDFMPDEFERNPYQAPRAAAHGAGAAHARTARVGVWDVLWFVYVAAFGLLVALAAVFAANPLGADTLIETATAGYALAGIVAWRLRRAWLIPLAWVVCFAVNLAWLAVQIRQSWSVLDTAGSTDVIALFVTGAAISTALHLPLFLGLVRYTFFSPSIWRPQAPRTEPGAA